MSLGSFLFGSRPRTERRDLLTGGQKDLLNDLIERVLSGQGFGLDEQTFQESFTAPATQEFESQIAPAIQQKFIGAGAGRGSNLQDALARAGVNVQGNLARQRAELLNQALNRQLQGAQSALGTRAFGFEQIPGSSGILPQIAGGVGAGLAGGVGSGLGQVGGDLFSRLFSGGSPGAAGGARTGVNAGFRR
jgi:hypothetical protein